MRGHNPIVIDKFNGLWKRGDEDSCPLDHWTDCSNVQFIDSGFETRDGIDTFDVGGSNFIGNVRRIYTYVRHNEESLLVLDSLGNIYHTGGPSPGTIILTIPTMTDFAFVNVSGRAYISPHDGVTGMEDEFLYVYMGNSTPARKAAGEGPRTTTLGSFTASSGVAGSVEAGFHIFAVVYETDTGFLTKLGPTFGLAPEPSIPNDNYYQFAELNAPGSTKINLSGIPVSPNSFVKARWIAATKAIDPAFYTGDKKGYQFFFVPEGRIDNNTATTYTVDFFDADLLQDATHLLDLFTEIKAGVFLTTYHGRLLLGGEFGAEATTAQEDMTGLSSVARVSYPGEPEAISEVDGLIVAPLDGNPLTNGQEYRDILYLFKKTRTYAYTDNGDVPSSWPLTIIDQGVGCSVHGIGTVLDSGGINIENLLVIDYSGVMIFTGIFPRPELSYKIKDFWLSIDRDDFVSMQIYNDSLNQLIYVNLPDKRILLGDYSEGLTPETIKWALWTFLAEITTITLMNTDELIIGSFTEP